MVREKRPNPSKRPEGVPPDCAGEQALRRWYAERYLAAITEDIGQLAQLQRLEHHVRNFLAQVIAWQRMSTYE